MKGWKTWASGIGSIFGGVGAIAVAISGDAWDWTAMQAGWALIVLGLGVIGIGHKVEKLKQ